MTNEKLLHTREEAAQMLSVSIRTIDNLIATNQLPSIRIKRRRLVTAQALAQFIRRDHFGGK